MLGRDREKPQHSTSQQFKFNSFKYLCYVIILNVLSGLCWDTITKLNSPPLNK
jgi:hypothetical protein